MKYPSYLKGHVKDLKDKFLSTMTLCSSTLDEELEIWYCGDLSYIESEKQNYIVDTDNSPMLIVARDKSKEEFVVYDASKYGYDNMFLNVYDDTELKNRKLKKFDIPFSKIILELGYSIDYEDEKDEYNYDENKNIILIDKRVMPLEQVMTDGYDYLSLSYVDKKGKIIQFVDLELA